jgi:NAD(P)-dependent dehydrogenase (short-subunit alcohol dehydrogenase family)
MGPITDRNVVVTGDGPLAEELLDGLESLGVAALHLGCTFESEDAVRAAMTTAETRLHGIDQVVHTWLAPGIVAPHRFVDLTDDEWADRCEGSLAAAWWLARASAEPLRASSGSLVFVVPTLAAVAEGIRVLAKACRRQWGVDGATVNTVAAAPHHWVDAEAADALTRGISLSTPAFGGHGSAADDLAPLIALLDDPDAHFLTAATLVADGGTWVGL